MSAKDHHYIPQLVLRNFVDETGRLHFWRRGKPVGEVGFIAPQNLFFRRYLYSWITSDGRRENQLEDFFSQKIEDAAGPLFNRMFLAIRGGRAPELTPEDWRTWQEFWYFQMKRTPTYINALADKVALAEFIDGGVAAALAAGQITADQVVPERKRILQNIRVAAQSTAPSDKVRRAIDNTGIAIYRVIRPNKGFIVGDMLGASIYANADDGRRLPVGFLPVAHDIAIGLAEGRRTVEIIPLRDDVLRRMNEATAARSDTIAGRSRALVASLSRSVPERRVSPLLSAAHAKGL